ncbi:MAG: hypothetical protein PVJ21_13900 [Anaerolineales bacterium]|jgi:hypothetical protein
MTQTNFTIGQIAEILECKEHTVRMLLNVAGANPRLSEYNHNMDEIVARQTIMDLASMRADGMIGRRLTRLLGPWTTEN